MERNIGVYKILNIIDGKYYIGSSVHLKKRLKDHKFTLNAGNHQNIHLQRAFNKYGAENFVFSILEYSDNLDNVREKEQKWIDKLAACNQNYGYNIHPLAVGGSVKGKKSNNYGNKGIKNPLSRQVAQIDPNNFGVVKVWGSLSMADDELNINKTHISNVCTFFLDTGLLKKSKGYFWCFAEDIEKIKLGKEFTFSDRKPVTDHSKKVKFGSDNGMSKKVARVDLETGERIKYDCIKEAAVENGINPQVIYNKLFRKPKNPKGFKWEYI